MANLNVARMIIGGRLVRDPELKVTPNGINMCSFTVAVDKKTRSGQEKETYFFRVKAWRKVAEKVATYFHKGSNILCIGDAENEKYTGRDGVIHEVTKLTAEDVFFVDSKNEATAPMPNYTEGTEDAAEPNPYTDNPQFAEIGDDEDLPFE